MRGPLANIMKQAQQAQNNLKKIQDEVAATEIIGQAGAGMVVITMTGRHEVRRVQLESELLKEEKEMIEDLIAAAFNDGMHKAEQLMTERMSSLTAGMGLPPGFKLPI